MHDNHMILSLIFAATNIPLLNEERMTKHEDMRMLLRESMSNECRDNDSNFICRLA